MHFREKSEKCSVSVAEDFSEGTETRRAAAKPKQNTCSPQGGGNDPKQCPGDERDLGSELTMKNTEVLQQSVSANLHSHDGNEPKVLLLDGTRFSAEQHHCDNSDPLHDIFR